jgi:CheY-like chemotaxis protein
VTAYVVPPDDSWAARRMLAVALERLGYRVDELGAGRDWILLLS